MSSFIVPCFRALARQQKATKMVYFIAKTTEWTRTGCRTVFGANGCVRKMHLKLALLPHASNNWLCHVETPRRCKMRPLLSMNHSMCSCSCPKSSKPFCYEYRSSQQTETKPASSFQIHGRRRDLLSSPDHEMYLLTPRIRQTSTSVWHVQNTAICGLHDTDGKRRQTSWANDSRTGQFQCLTKFQS